MSALTAVQEIEAKLDADVGTHLGSDLQSERYAGVLAGGSTGYQLAAMPDGNGPAAGAAPDGNVNQTSVGLLCRVVHRLSDPEDERAFTRTTLFPLLADKLLVPSYWKTAAVFEVIEDPNASFPDDLERIDDVIRVTLSLALTVRA